MSHSRPFKANISRRNFLVGSLALGLTTRLIPLRPGPKWPTKPVRLAVITDLHHGLAPDALSRLDAFAKAIRQRKDIDAVVQMGDFCYGQPDSKPCIDLWNTIPHRKIHVLGNHDMDKCDKAAAMHYTGMKSRYGSHVIGGYRFVVLDLNHFKKQGKLFAYSKGNYFTDNATFNWADPEQLTWLEKELKNSQEPVILISHQPLGFADPGQPMPPEQKEVLKVVHDASEANPQGAVAISMFGHLHIDRLEHDREVPCYCVNSASYFWFNGMQKYTNPLFAFMELTPDGVLKVEGATGEFVKSPPKESDAVIGRSASIIDRKVGLNK